MSAWNQIEALRKEQGMTLAQLAAIAGVVPSAITKWKSGSQIRIDTLAKIAVHFGVSVDSLSSTPVSVRYPCAPPMERAPPTARVGEPAPTCARCAEKDLRIIELERQLEAERGVVSEQRCIIRDLAQTLVVKAKEDK